MAVVIKTSSESVDNPSNNILKLKESLMKNLCLLPFYSLQVDRTSFPEIEQDPAVAVIPKTTKSSLVFNLGMESQATMPLEIHLLPSINSLIVNIHITKKDQLDELLINKMMRCLTNHADQLGIIRRQPKHKNDNQAMSQISYTPDLSFLILRRHIEQYGIELMADLIIDTCKRIVRCVSETKLKFNELIRRGARQYLSTFTES